MLISAKKIAKEKIELYMNGLIVDGKVIVPGFSLEVAAKKAAASNPGFAKEIYQIAKRKV